MGLKAQKTQFPVFIGYPAHATWRTSTDALLLTVAVSQAAHQKLKTLEVGNIFNLPRSLSIKE